MYSEVQYPSVAYGDSAVARFPDEAEYLINTFRPHISERIKIDNLKFSKYHELIIDNRVVNSIYKKNK